MVRFRGAHTDLCSHKSKSRVERANLGYGVCSDLWSVYKDPGTPGRQQLLYGTSWH